jgi:acyl-CoA synthetase (AMP-forming)/AMP-acid ligase II
MLINGGQFLSERAKVSPRLEAQVDSSTGARFTYAQMNARANQVAHALLAAGFRPGERVACLMSNTHLYAESYYGCAKAGFVFVALNWRLTVPELAYQLADCGAVALLYSADQAATVAALKADFPQVAWLQADGGAFADAVAGASAAEPPLGASGEDPLYIMYTSGTTGKPKGAVHTHRSNIEWSHRMLATSDTRLGDRQIIVAPLFHIGGLGMVMCAVYRGCTSVIAKAFEPGAMWQLIADERITTTFLVPAMLNLMLQHPAKDAVDRRALRSILSGAAPVPVTLIEAYTAMGIEIHQVYGSTETHGGICIIAPDYAALKQGSTGLPYFGIEVRVVDAHGRDVPPGVPGEVVTRGPHLFKHYWNRPDETASSYRDGWFYIGDIAEVDEDGFVYIKDRSKDMIISGAENIYPAEVEDVLLSHPGVKEVAVIGQPSARWGESPAAIVVRADGFAGDDADLKAALHAHVQGRLARYKQPKVYEIADAIPRNASGKILKRLLRDQFPGPAPE